jgi:hypothetical protein
MHADCTAGEEEGERRGGGEGRGGLSEMRVSGERLPPVPSDKRGTAGGASACVHMLSFSLCPGLASSRRRCFDAAPVHFRQPLPTWLPRYRYGILVERGRIEGIEIMKRRGSAPNADARLRTFGDVEGPGLSPASTMGKKGEAASSLEYGCGLCFDAGSAVCSDRSAFCFWATSLGVRLVPTLPCAVFDAPLLFSSFVRLPSSSLFGLVSFPTEGLLSNRLSADLVLPFCSGFVVAASNSDLFFSSTV